MFYMSLILKKMASIIKVVFLKIIFNKKIKYEGIPNISFSTLISIRDNGQIILKRNIGIRRNCTLSTSENGKIQLGSNVFFNSGCMVVAHKLVSIGNNTKIGPNVLIFDHDYDYKNRKTFMEGKHISKEIIIGKNCWIGAGTIILKGTVIGDNCVVGAGSIIKGNYSEGTVIVQKNNEIIKKYLNN